MTTPFSRLSARTREIAEERRVEIGIPMRDGVELAADVYFPRVDTDQGAPPAIVEVTPYGKRGALFGEDEGRLYQEHGYVFVSVDVRGRGASEGEWSAFENDAHDTHDVVEWVAAQPWCDGQVGTTGLSYMGWVQWAAASERPPHLRCMVSTSAAGRWQQEIPYTNGIFQLYFAWWAYATRRRIPDSYGLETRDWDAILRTLPFDAMREIIDPTGPTWDNVAGRDTLDDFWRALRYDDRYHEIDVPCLHVTGWYDLEDLLGAFHHYEHMKRSSPSRDQQYLIVGPWSHVKSRFPDRAYGGLDFGPSAALDMDAEHLRWFDHWLKGREGGLDAEARVRVFEPGRNSWRRAPSWPLSNRSWSLYLGVAAGQGVLTDTCAGDETRTSYRYDPLDPVLTGLDVGEYPLADVPLEQTANDRRADVLCYTSEPAVDALTVSGWPSLELWASSDGDDTDWHVKINDVHPDGRSYKVTQGCLRAACRDSLETPAPIVPDEMYRFVVEMWPTHHVFLPGHRVRVSVTSSDFPWFARSLNRFGDVRHQDDVRVATNTVVHGPLAPSHLVLPIEE